MRNMPPGRAAHFHRRSSNAGAYEGALRDLIHLFKYQGTKPAGKLLGQLLHQATTGMAFAGFAGGDSGSAMVGQATDARIQSGRSHCASLFEHSECQQHPIGYVDSLPHTRYRFANRAYAASAAGQCRAALLPVLKPERIKGRPALLIVDDVMTTGTTGRRMRQSTAARRRERFLWPQ